MAGLRYYTSSGVLSLKNSIATNLDWYFEPTARPPFVAPAEIRDTRMALPALDELEVDHSKPSANDGANALHVFNALRNLNLRQAADERLWVYLCHIVNPRYVAERWLAIRPDLDEKAAIMVRNHYFVGSNRAVVRDNGLSRLWWLGRIANDVDESAPGHFLTILLHRQDVRSALIERPSVSTNIRVLRAVYAVMREHWGGDRRLFEREIFRGWMRGLNRRGGVVLLDALPEQQLAELVSELALESLEQ